MKTLLTVDWDFFCEEKPEWDIGHQESLLFLKMLWGTRIGLMDQMKTDGNEVDFWQNFKGVKFLFPTWVSESHAYAYSCLAGVSRVVLFDAHHDCWEGDNLHSDKTAKGVFCHNWLRTWLLKGKNRKATWVKPKWQDACELPKDMKKRVDVVVYSKGMDLGLKGSIIPHICRSGCWVPPWLDRAFLGFVEGFRGTMEMVVPMQDGEWNPLKERWTAENFVQYSKQEKMIQAMRDNVTRAGLAKNVKIVTVKSSEFLNCKVEQAVAT